MVSVMGGTTDSQPYLWFEELCVKAFLVCRQYVDKLTHCVVLMLDSGYVSSLFLFFLHFPYSLGNLVASLVSLAILGYQRSRTLPKRWR
jgi:hypothetical protein